MLLKNKVAVIYGAGGGIGGAVTRAFAREGAKLFLTGPHLATVEAVAKDLHSAGGSAGAAEVDALDEQAMDMHLQSVIDKAGRPESPTYAWGTAHRRPRDRQMEAFVGAGTIGGASAGGSGAMGAPRNI